MTKHNKTLTPRPESQVQMTPPQAQTTPPESQAQTTSSNYTTTTSRLLETHSKLAERAVQEPRVYIAPACELYHAVTTHFTNLPNLLRAP